MEKSPRPIDASVSDGASGTVRATADPALRDAREILARVAADEAAADRVRESLRSGPLAPLAPDEQIARHLRPGEQVLAVRRTVLVERRQREPSGGMNGLGGDLYVTSERLVLLGRRTVEFELADINDAVLAGESVLLAMRNGDGASLDAAEPRLLRVQIAATRARLGG